MSAAPRLYVAPDLAAGSRIGVDEEQAHYLTRVLRLGAGETVRVFNGRDGEFDARIAAAGKRGVELDLLEQTRAQPEQAPDVWLLFAPLKKTRTDFLVEKAVELGASELRPVLTVRTGAETVRTDRLQRLCIEAAEQTERLDLPPVREAEKLEAALAKWPEGRALLFADEAGDEGGKPWGGEQGRAPSAAEVIAGLAGSHSAIRPGAILIGPEGGFDPKERAWLRGLPFVKPVGLGPRILRAETAAAAALTLWQALAGDWRGVPRPDSLRNK